ncbi:MAG TPA: acetyl-CoA carboxylase biotin carboxyl carrier protein [Alphaproteobacteria bacterium]|nr:acetyl-CoA carboxylase biotin carboxyl carrier protein [Alphaproteobacteria bacterium]
MPKTDIDSALVRRLAQLLDETGLTELEYATDHWRVRVARQPGLVQAALPMANAQAPAAVPSEAPAPTVEPPPDASHPGAILSPMVGTVYLAPEPGAAPFVQVGDQVKPGQTLLIVEAMKVMNPVTAQRGGRLARVLVENGAPVEYGAVLMIIE